MITNMLKKYIFAGLMCCSFAAVLTACSSDEDPFYTASEDDMPRILNTDIPEGKKGEPASLPSIDRTTNFTLDLIVTPAHYTTVTWFIDDVQVAEGLSIDVPVQAGDHMVKVVATTTKGLSTYRLLTLNVRPGAEDPYPAGKDIHETLVIPGSVATMHGVHMEKVAKVIIGGQSVDATYMAGDDCIVYTVPTLPDGIYPLQFADASGFVYGAGSIELNQNPEYPVTGEVTVLEGDFVIDWNADICNVPAAVFADFAEGSIIRIYYEVPEAEYHNMRICSKYWNDVPGGAQIDVTGETPNPFVLTLTEQFKNLVTAEEGMSCVGFGYTVKKITIEEPSETALLEGNFVIDWDAAICHLTPDAMANVPVGATIRIYYEVPEAEYHNLRIVSNYWNDVPGGAQIDVTAETPNPFVLTYTEEFKNLINAEEGWSCVGFGYTVTKITYE
jgi:hypothetical protein